MTQIIRSEWTKLWSVRSTRWWIALVALITIGLSIIATSVFTANWATLSPENRVAMENDTIGLILQPAVMFSQLVVCVLAVLVITSEVSSGTIKVSVLAVPRRIRLVLGKIVTLCGVVFVVAEVAAFVSFFAGQAITSRHVTVHLSDPGVMRAIFSYGAYLVAVALFSYGLGLILRRSAGAITAAIVALYVLPNVASLIPGAGNRLSNLLPASNNSQMVMSTGINEHPYAPGIAMVAFVVWAACTLIAGAMLMTRRDV